MMFKRQNLICLSLIFAFGFLFGCSSSSDLEWVEENGYKWAEVSPGFFGSTGFKQLSSSRTNITFVNSMSREKIGENRHFLNGSGVAAGDINGNGLVDLYFAGFEGPNRLYKNLGGMKFEDITEQAGVAHEGYYSTGTVFADVNGNGHLDLLVTSLNGDNVLYLNDGEGNFERDENSGLGPARGSITMTLSDITGNGFPDLYIANYKEKSVKDLYTTEEMEWERILNEPYNARQQTGPYTLVPPFDEHYQIYMTDDNRLAGVAELGEEDELYLNQNGTFQKVSDTREIFLDSEGNPFGLQPDWGLTAKFQDLNGNGLQDLYVCNDFHTKDRVWMNQGDGTFKAINELAIRNFSFACMGVDFSDINRNGEVDIFTAEMLNPEHNHRLRQVGSEDPLPNDYRYTESSPTFNRNSLYLKREDETYAEIAYLSGVEATGWSWDARFMDVNLNGYEDLIVTNGYLYHILDMDAQLEMVRRQRNMDEHFYEFLQYTPPLELPNRILMNNGDLTFTDRSSFLGFDTEDISHGMAAADLNNNGVLDLVINRMNKEAGIYQNTTNSPRISVRLKGRSPNTQAIGAKVVLEGGPVTQRKEVASGGDYASGSDPLLMFAANPDHEHRITIYWADGTVSKIDNVKANRIYEIDQSSISVIEPNSLTSQDNAATTSMENGNIREPLFEDISDQLMHTHHDEMLNDFELQPLLPMSLGHLGPGVAWIDWNGNGMEDLFIASGKDGQLSIFENQHNGKFESVSLSPITQPAPGDQTAILGWQEDEHLKIVMGSSNYEQGSSHAPSAFVYKIEPSYSFQIAQNDFRVEIDTIPGILSTTGPIAAADVSGNGYLDLFIGGRFKPGEYPADADSRLFINRDGSYQLDAANSQTLSELGLVTGAVFSDITQNGRQDLLISTEWGSLRLFENRNGRLTEITSDVGLDAYKGWWNGIATGDFTNNGYIDIVAANRGLNSSYQMREGEPLRMYYSDFNWNNRLEIIEAYADSDGRYVPKRRLYNFGLIPEIANEIQSHEQFANTNLEEIFGERLSEIPYKEINTLEHMVFLNTGSGFEAQPLPLEAQFSSSFHVGVADFDNDGNEDIFLSQNFFAVPQGEPRMDAGRGLVLLGDGKGNFEPLSGTDSGVKIYGEQRGAAFSDFNQDGKVDLVVTQNNYKTRLYANRTEKRGYRITLNGPPENRNGFGSGIRLVYKDEQKHGPLREVQAGSGYWSQNSSTQIMGAEAEVERIEIYWFDGTSQSVNVRDGEKDYEITYQPD